jgi:hypothetical protein
MAASRMKNDFAPAWLKLPNQENVKPTTPRNVGDWTFERSFSEQGSDYHVEATAYEDIMTTPRVIRPRAYSTRSGPVNGYQGNGSGQRLRVKPGRGTRNYNYMNDGDCDVTDHDAENSGQSSRARELTYQVDRFTGCSQDGCRTTTHEPKLDVVKERTSISIEDEFPSLNGEIPNRSGKPSYSKVASVWDGSIRESSVVVRTSAAVTPTESGPKPLVLKTGIVKRSVADTDKLSNGVSNSSCVADSSKPKLLRNGHKEPQPSVMTTAKVLTACLKQPKEAGDRKSNFFKLIRRESHETGTDLSHTELTGSLSTPADTGSVDQLTVTANGASCSGGDGGGTAVFCSHSAVMDSTVHSSPVEVVFSSEGELRLMHEMGWKETDYEGEDYEITEEDVQEFQALCRRLQQEQLSCPKLPLHSGFARVSGYVSKVLSSLSPQPPSSYKSNVMPSLSSAGSDFSDDSDAASSS